jgi:tetratricopeptide (TPR) repeat protein/Zn-dependent protease
MSKLFKEISESKYGEWALYAIGGLVSVSLFPAFSLGWLCLNIVIFHFVYTMSIVLHELGQAVAALLLGMEVTEIVIGCGENVFDFKLFGIPWRIKQFPICGAVYVLRKSTYFYRSRMFLISLFGPLTNLILVCLPLKFPREFMTISPTTIYIIPGIIICFVNIELLSRSLFPHHFNIYGLPMPTDGLRMLTLPFLSKREVAIEVSEGLLFDGYNLACNENYQKAIDSFSKAIQYNPDYFESYHRRGNAYRKIKNDRQAIDDYQRAIDLISQRIKLERLNAANYYSRAIIYQDWMKIEPINFHNAVEDLTKAIDLDPSNNSFYFLRAAIYSRSDYGEQSIEDFTTAIELSPNGDAYYNRGVTYYQFNKYQSAIEDLDMVINLNGNDISAYYVRGNAKYELQDKIGAFEDYDRAKFLSSTKIIKAGDEDGFYARGIAYIRLGNRVEAIEDLQMAESLCLEHGSTSLLKQIREELKKISIK